MKGYTKLLSTTRFLLVLACGIICVLTTCAGLHIWVSHNQDQIERDAFRMTVAFIEHEINDARHLWRKQTELVNFTKPLLHKFDGNESTWWTDDQPTVFDRQEALGLWQAIQDLKVNILGAFSLSFDEIIALRLLPPQTAQQRRNYLSYLGELYPEEPSNWTSQIWRRRTIFAETAPPNLIPLPLDRDAIIFEIGRFWNASSTPYLFTDLSDLPTAILRPEIGANSFESLSTLLPLPDGSEGYMQLLAVPSTSQNRHQAVGIIFSVSAQDVEDTSLPRVEIFDTKSQKPIATVNHKTSRDVYDDSLLIELEDFELIPAWGMRVQRLAVENNLTETIVLIWSLGTLLTVSYTVALLFIRHVLASNYRRDLEQQAIRERAMTQEQSMQYIFHEIRNPVHVLLATIGELQMEGGLAPETEKTFRDMRESLVEIVRLIQDRLEDGGTLAIEFKSISVAEATMKEVHNLSQLLSMQQFIRVSVDSWLVAHSVTQDGRRIQQIVRNAVSNAYKHGEPSALETRASITDLWEVGGPNFAGNKRERPKSVDLVLRTLKIDGELGLLVCVYNKGQCGVPLGGRCDHFFRQRGAMWLARNPGRRSSLARQRMGNGGDLQPRLSCLRSLCRRSGCCSAPREASGPRRSSQESAAARYRRPFPHTNSSHSMNDDSIFQLPAELKNALQERVAPPMVVRGRQEPGTEESQFRSVGLGLHVVSAIVRTMSGYIGLGDLPFPGYAASPAVEPAQQAPAEITTNTGCTVFWCWVPVAATSKRIAAVPTPTPGTPSDRVMPHGGAPQGIGSTHTSSAGRHSTGSATEHLLSTSPGIAAQAIPGQPMLDDEEVGLVTTDRPMPVRHNWDGQQAASEVQFMSKSGPVSGGDGPSVATPLSPKSMRIAPRDRWSLIDDASDDGDAVMVRALPTSAGTSPLAAIVGVPPPAVEDIFVVDDSPSNRRILSRVVAKLKGHTLIPQGARIHQCEGGASLLAKLESCMIDLAAPYTNMSSITASVSGFQAQSQSLSGGEGSPPALYSKRSSAIPESTYTRPLRVVVFLDIQMPGIDGVQAADAMRKRPWRDEVLVVACTASVTPMDVARYARVGFQGVLKKPFDIMTAKDLLQRLTLQVVEGKPDDGPLMAGLSVSADVGSL